MDLTAQIPDVTVGRAANAPHYEYMTTFGKRTADLPVDHGRGRETPSAHERGQFSHRNNTPLPSAVKLNE